MKIEQLHKKFLECSTVTTDTRNISENSMFFALKGERFDANEFAIEAIEKGAKFAVIDNPKYFIENKTILVNDSLDTLQQLAKYHRNHLKDIKIIGSGFSSLAAACYLAKEGNKVTVYEKNSTIGGNVWITESAIQ